MKTLSVIPWSVCSVFVKKTPTKIKFKWLHFKNQCIISNTHMGGKWNFLWNIDYDEEKKKVLCIHFLNEILHSSHLDTSLNYLWSIISNAWLRTSNPINHVRHVTMRGLVALTCIVHDINVGPQLRTGKVVAVLNWVIESRQQDE